jgi:hypothetical protein
VLICYVFGTHKTLEILEFFFKHNILLCRIPPHTSHKLQPCDIAVFDLVKAAYRDQAEQLERGGVNTIVKGHFTYLYSPARKRAFTKKNNLARWAKSGLFPFNPDRVLRNIPRPATAHDNPKVCKVDIGRCPESNAAQKPVMPVTQVTPDALTALQDLINEDAHGLDEMRKR